MKASLLAFVRSRRYTLSLVTVSLLAAAVFVAFRLRAHGQGSYQATPGAGKYYDKHYDWQDGDYPPNTVKGEAVDEARSGMTLNRTPVSIRVPECFPAEPRDVFWQMDMVAGPDGKLQPLNFDENGDNKVDEKERDGIRGRNTWLLWGGGNETFWDWLQQKGYGLTDFLILMDSRRRDSRFKDAGLITQPGFVRAAEPILGLYIDQANPDGSAILKPPPDPAAGAAPPPAPGGGDYGYDPKPDPEVFDAQGRRLETPVNQPVPPAGHYTELFEPWTTPEQRAKEWTDATKEDPFKDYVPEVVRRKLPKDGLDPTVYGYPSGIFGLRLMLNPDFFAKTDEAAKARSYWKERVEQTNGQYYTSIQIHSDPKLVRPFRVSMSCGFCHIGPHPLNPPKDPEKPNWDNLSGVIGAQYWDPQPAFGNLVGRPNFLHHFLKSQAPGTVDTSLVSTDQINNTNIINAIFDVPARLDRARNKPTEKQSRENLLLPSVEDPDTSNNPDGQNKYRHFPMVLFPGEDSVGVWGALARVPLNIGVFSEQWMRCDNPVIGFTPQRPFSVEVSRKNSVYWQVNERYRVNYMASFFTLGTQKKVPKSTAAMKLKDAGPEGGSTLGQVELAKDSPEKRAAGRKVFLNNCAICHSSKQPPGFDLKFDRKMAGGWDKAPVPADPIYTLPADYRDWDSYKQSPSYRAYVEQITKLAGELPAPDAVDPFIDNNFLSNELRIPVTLVGTYAGRAMATNAMAGQVWDNYSSDTFKALPSVGRIRYFNPYKSDASAVSLDPYGTNDEFDDGRTHGGPGYFRPASLISLWATAPYFHNNTLGLYNQDPSVNGRLVAFNDGIRKLLWPKERTLYARDGITYAPHPGDLRAEGSAAAKNDPGYIYRLPVDTYVSFQPGFTPLLVQSVLIGFVGHGPGMFLFWVLSYGLWLILALVFCFLIFWGRARHAGILLLLLGLVLAALLIVTGAGGGSGMMAGALMAAVTNMMSYANAWLWLLVIAILAAGVLLLLTRIELKWLTKLIFIVATIIVLVVGILANKFLTGELKNVPLHLAILPNSSLNADYKGINVGPLPRGTPVNLLMSMDPSKGAQVAPAVVALLKASVQIQKQRLTGEEAYAVIAKQAGPALIAASKCPDFVLDHGHYFGDVLDPDSARNDEAKEALIAFLKTL
ncbi:MAG TPA: cytochrome c [Chthoniobacterales bacterium]|nr:cytochrome c [Chthoniobacterales bacterium]